MHQTIWNRTIMVAAAVLLSIQLIPVRGTNPPIETDVPAAPGVRAVLRRACYNCHSNETHWPWYAYVAPISWLVGHDVEAGRRAVNFSKWQTIDPLRQRSAMRTIVHRVAKGHMPPWFYVALHPEARLSENDRNVLREWAALAIARAPAGQQASR